MKNKLLFAIGLALMAIAITGCPDPGGDAFTYVGGVPVYLDGVSAADAATAIGYLNIMYNAGDFPKETFKSKVTSIRITTGSTADMDGAILKVGYQAAAGTIASFLQSVLE
jgi:hypothetical protein